MTSRFILPVLAVLLLTTAPVLAQDASAETPRAEKSLADMWDKKYGDKKHDGEKGERRAAWKADKEKMKDMTPEQRHEFMESRAAERKAEMMAEIEKMPPEKQEEARKKMAEFEAKREAVRKELMGLPPEERAARMEELHKEMKEKHKGDREAKFKKRWNDASAEDRAAFCARSVEKCTGGEDEPRLCVKAKDLCNAQ
ncbi:MAG: DUF3106 domain-containing protein [Alphaproteobacteria bacterium]|nr:DUF3106 domain-containing protein [Alphaproteobacteria bacterium]